MKNNGYIKAQIKNALQFFKSFVSMTIQNDIAMSGKSVDIYGSEFSREDEKNSYWKISLPDMFDGDSKASDCILIIVLNNQEVYRENLKDARISLHKEKESIGNDLNL